LLALGEEGPVEDHQPGEGEGDPEDAGCEEGEGDLSRRPREDEDELDEDREAAGRDHGGAVAWPHPEILGGDREGGAQDRPHAASSSERVVGNACRSPGCGEAWTPVPPRSTTTREASSQSSAGSWVTATMARSRARQSPIRPRSSPAA